MGLLHDGMRDFRPRPSQSPRGSSHPPRRAFDPRHPLKLWHRDAVSCVTRENKERSGPRPKLPRQTDTEAILKAEIENGGMRLPVFEGAQRFTTIADRPDHAKAFVSKNLGDHQSDARLVLNDQNTLPTIFLHRLAPPNSRGR